METTAAAPSREMLAECVSKVTQTMLGLSFKLAKRERAQEDDGWHAAVLTLVGKNPLTVGLTANPSGGLALGAAMFACERDAVDTEIINDSLCELLNMTAGLLKRSLQNDNTLGLPEVLEPGQWMTRENVLCKATLEGGGGELAVWITRS